MNVRRRNPIGKWIKDYIVPIIWFVLIFILLFSVFSWDNNSTKIDTENKIWLELVLNWANAESFIVYPWDYKKQIEWDISLYKWEKVIVKEWTINLSLLWLWDLKLNKLWELKYLENWDFALYSSDLWLNSVSWINVEMKFATIKVGENTNISFSQNEVWSTIYLMNWFAEVENLSWLSTVLASGQKITISRLDANKKDIDLSLNKENIDDYYKQSDWFILNNWSSYLDSDETIINETFSWSLINSTWNSSKLINLTNLSDESNVSSDTITVSWNYVDNEITKITLNGHNASINKELKTFTFENVSVANRENDLVFKVYDDANDLLSKFIYVVYYEWWVAQNNSNYKFTVQTFNVDGSKFIFSTIKDWVLKNLNWQTSYTTYWDFLTLYWSVTSKWVSSVSVNGYKLQSYNWSTWRYHASSVNNNLSIWTNVYEVKYYDTSWKVLYTNHFTIIKKTIDSNIYSDETKIKE